MLKQTVVAVVVAASVVSAGVAAHGAQAPAQPPAQPRPARTAPRPAQPTPLPAQPTAPPEQAPAPARAPEPPGQPVNIKLDITITDQGTPGDPSQKTVTMVIADRAGGSIRTGGTQMPTEFGGPAPITINVDATPTILRDGSIRLQFGLEYQPRPGSNPAQPSAAPVRMSQVNQRLAVIVQDGKPLVISQAADAASDRKITVELKATILK